MRSCTQCGKCCLKYSDGGLKSASDEDILRWRKKKPEVLEYTESISWDLWISPITGEEMKRCPWLRKLPNKDVYKCRIHDVKPDICRGYPYAIDQMIKDQCEMLEAGDLDKPPSQLMSELNELRNSSGS